MTWSWIGDTAVLYFFNWLKAGPSLLSECCIIVHADSGSDIHFLLGQFASVAGHPLISEAAVDGGSGKRSPHLPMSPATLICVGSVSVQNIRVRALVRSCRGRGECSWALICLVRLWQTWCRNVEVLLDSLD